MLNRLLAVPSLRTRYLRYVKDMATTWLDWKQLGPLAAKFQRLIDADVQRDTRKLDSYDLFRALVDQDREVMGNRGKVRIVYTRRPNDPSMQKMAPVKMLEVEDWLKVDGEWYRDLKR